MPSTTACRSSRLYPVQPTRTQSCARRALRSRRVQAPTGGPLRLQCTSDMQGLSPEQRAFMERKRSQSGSTHAPSTSSTDTSQLSPEQRAFLERKNQSVASPPPTSSAPVSGRPQGLSAEQQAFLDRKQASSSGVTSSVGGFSSEQAAFLERKESSSDAFSSSGSLASTAVSSPTSSTSSGLTPEQLAYLERRTSTKRPTSDRSGLTPEQRAFLDRKDAGSYKDFRKLSPIGTSFEKEPISISTPKEEQTSFWDRKETESIAAPVAPPPAPTPPPVYTPSPSPPITEEPAFISSTPKSSKADPHLTPEQLAFLERKNSRKEGEDPIMPGEVCPRCNGLGSVVCWACDGTKINREDVQVEAFHNEKMKSDFAGAGHIRKGWACWLCRGQGQLACPDCGGSGFLHQHDLMGD